MNDLPCSRLHFRRIKSQVVRSRAQPEGREVQRWSRKPLCCLGRGSNPQRGPRQSEWQRRGQCKRPVIEESTGLNKGEVSQRATSSPHGCFLHPLPSLTPQPYLISLSADNLTPCLLCTSKCFWCLLFSFFQVCLLSFFIQGQPFPWCAWPMASSPLWNSQQVFPPLHPLALSCPQTCLGRSPFKRNELWGLHSKILQIHSSYSLAHW